MDCANTRDGAAGPGREKTDSDDRKSFLDNIDPKSDARTSGFHATIEAHNIDRNMA